MFIRVNSWLILYNYTYEKGISFYNIFHASFTGLYFWRGKDERGGGGVPGKRGPWY